MPQDNLTPLTSTITAGESLKIEQAPQGSPVGGEETPAAPNNAESTKPAQEAVTSDESKPYVSGAKKARELGESRRKLARALLDAAKSSQEVRAQIKQLSDTSPDLDRYLQKHFAKDYQVIFKDRIEAEVEAEMLETADKEKAKARAELLVETLREEKVELAEDLAARLHFTRSQADALQQLALKLEGAEIGDEQLTFEKALERAAITISPQKAKVGISLPSGIPQTPQFVEQEVQNSKLEELATISKKFKGGRKDKIMENLKIVDKGFKNGVFQLPMGE